MKTTRKLSLLLLALCFAAVLLTLTACQADMDVGNNTELANQFMDHVIADDYDAAYGMVKATVTDPDFRAYWVSIQTAVEGATSYEIEQTGWQINTVNGVTDRTTAYQVYPNNGHTVLLRVVTREGIEGIAGIHFSDITGFLRDTEAFVPTVQIILWVVSGLFVAFTVWMFVDCLCRKMKYKAVWAIVIFFGLALTLTVGKASNFTFTLGLFFQPSTIIADPGLLAVVTKAVFPVGAILYLCLRKRFTVESSDPQTENNTEETQTPINE
jgi:hypothetical protein